MQGAECVERRESCLDLDGQDKDPNTKNDQISFAGGQDQVGVPKSKLAWKGRDNSLGLATSGLVTKGGLKSSLL